jgi:hypothetical protein
MANLVKWGTPASPVNLLTTELNNLGNNTVSGLGPSFDNGSAARWVYADIECILASLTPTAGGSIIVYLAEAPDGANYSDAKREAAQQILCSFTFDTAAAAKRQTARNVMLPPGKFKAYIDNQCGVALAASGSSIVMYAYAPEVQ